MFTHPEQSVASVWVQLNLFFSTPIKTELWSIYHITMRVSFFVSLLIASANAACSRDSTALTSDCSSQCYEGRPCIAFASDASCNATTFGTCVKDGNSSSGSAADSCTFECFTNGANDFAANGALEFTEYVFFIPYGSDESKWEASWTSSQASTVDSQLASEEDETQFYPSESNLVFNDIEPLKFQTETTTAMFVGGTSVWGVRGKVSQLKLSAEFLSANTQLKNMYVEFRILRSIYFILSIIRCIVWCRTMVNLGFDSDPPQSTFPTTNIESFRMSNCLLSTYPADLEFMTSVVHIDFSQNYFKDYPVKFSHDSMETLNLSTNALTACSGDFPNLTNLVLDLSDNSFTGVSLTADHVSFLQSLESFTIDTFGDVSSCSEAAQVEIGGAAVCTSTGDAGSSSSSSDGINSSNIGAIVGGIVGAIVVALVLGVAFFYYRRPGGNPLADVAILQLVASGQLLPTFGPQCPPELHELARRCMAYNPQARPTAVEVAFALRTLHKSGAFN
ncbi:Leucine-rich repeat domain, L domain-like [Phytophthora cactorum]|nr:Leucine-rich repeat domain, L domain-like [Phytophthora cactorum]